MKNSNRFLLISLCLVLLGTSVLAQSRRRKPVISSKPPSTEETKQLADAASQSRANLIEASTTYQQSLEKVLELQRQEEQQAAALVEKQRVMLNAGIISRRELEESEQALIEIRQRVAETFRQVEEIDRLVTEVVAAEQLAKSHSEPAGELRTGIVLIRYTGTTSWSLSNYSVVDNFFREQFGRPLPISAFGQTGVHNRLGFDHKGALDVAVHPDSAEGKALMAFLRAQGIPFIAFRAPVAGSATGAHIHIGAPSHRTAPHR